MKIDRIAAVIRTARGCGIVVPEALSDEAMRGSILRTLRHDVQRLQAAVADGSSESRYTATWACLAAIGDLYAVSS